MRNKSFQLYQRLSSTRRTINQLNNLHIALENWLTPEQFTDLERGIRALPVIERDSPSRGGIETSSSHILPEQSQWLDKQRRIFNRAQSAIPEPFSKHCLSKHVRLYSNDSIPRKDKTLIICYTGKALRMMMPLHVLLQHMDASKVDIFYVRYPRQGARIGFREGLDGIADTFESAVDRLSQLAQWSDYAKVCTFGTSGGAFPAVLACLKMGFDRCLAVGCNHPDDWRWREALGRNAGDLILDYKSRLSATPRISLAYGADEQIDIEAAKAIGSLIPIKSLPIRHITEPVRHIALPVVLNAGQLKNFFTDYLFP